MIWMISMISPVAPFDTLRTSNSAGFFVARTRKSLLTVC